MSVTERLIFPVQGSQEQWKEGLKCMLQTLKTQEGCIRTRWVPRGPFFPNPASDFGPATENFKPHIRSGEKPTVYFVQFTPYAPKEIIDAALVHLITIYGPSASEDSIRASLAEYSSVEGCTGVAGGYATSDVEGKKTFVSIMGWSTLEASAASKGTVNIETEGGSIEEHHVNSL